MSATPYQLLPSDGDGAEHNKPKQAQPDRAVRFEPAVPQALVADPKLMRPLAWSRPSRGPYSRPRPRGTASSLGRQFNGVAQVPVVVRPPLRHRSARIPTQSTRRDRERKQRRHRSRRYATSGSEEEGHHARGATWGGWEAHPEDEPLDPSVSRRLTAMCLAEEMDTSAVLAWLRRAVGALPLQLTPGVPVKWTFTMVTDVLLATAVPKSDADVEAVLDRMDPPLPARGLARSAGSLNALDTEGGDADQGSGLHTPTFGDVEGADRPPVVLPLHPRRRIPSSLSPTPLPDGDAEGAAVDGSSTAGHLAAPWHGPTDGEKESDVDAAATRAALEAQLAAEAAAREEERVAREAALREARLGAVRREASGDVLIFPFGCTVTWGLTEEQEHTFLAALRDAQLLVAPLAEPEEDDMMWHYCTNPRADTEGAGETSLSGDDVELCSTCASEKLAASYAFAQSTKLSVSERQVDAEIERTKHVPVTLARTGKIPLSASAISKQTGVLFILRSSVNLTSDILDTPEVFWDDDSFEPTYELATAYLDLSTRVDIVNTRLDILRELLDMLSSQLEVDHSVRLEWIVIWLIVAEVVLELASILWDHFDRHNEEF